MLTFPLYGPKGRAFVTMQVTRTGINMWEIDTVQVDLVNGVVHEVDLHPDYKVIDLHYLMWKLQRQYEQKQAAKGGVTH